MRDIPAVSSFAVVHDDGMDTSTRRTIGRPDRIELAELSMSATAPATESFVATLDPSALNRLLRIYAAVISAGVAATGAIATVL